MKNQIQILNIKNIFWFLICIFYFLFFIFNIASAQTPGSSMSDYTSLPDRSNSGGSGSDIQAPSGRSGSDIQAPGPAYSETI